MIAEDEYIPPVLEDKIMTGQICPYCGRETEYIDSERIYGRSYGMVYACLPCDAWVGVHRGTNKAKGMLANKQLRYWREKAHELFDGLWRHKIKLERCKKHTARTAAYKWLSEAMGLPTELTHIGMFNEQQCKQVIELCKPHYKITEEIKPPAVLPLLNTKQ